MDKIVKLGIVVLILCGLLIFLGSLYLVSNTGGDNVALAKSEDNPFTLIGTPPGTQNVLVYMLRQQGGVSTYTCFLVIAPWSVDVSCP